MSPVDLNTINRKIKKIQDDLERLKNFSNISLSDYIDDEEKQAIVERLLERIVGRTIDINYHLLKEEYKTIPDDFTQSFTMLGAKIEAPQDLVEQVSKSASVRNRLVHEYDDTDPTKIYSAFKDCLVQIPQYLDYILKFLDK